MPHSYPVIGLMASLFLLPSAAWAEAPERVQTLVVYGNDPCPKAEDFATRDGSDSLNKPLDHRGPEEVTPSPLVLVLRGEREGYRQAHRQGRQRRQAAGSTPRRFG